jgi:hypothetical protein
LAKLKEVGTDISPTTSALGWGSGSAENGFAFKNKGLGTAITVYPLRAFSQRCGRNHFAFPVQTKNYRS